MEKKLPEGIINEEAVITLNDFSSLCDVEIQYIIEMVDMGILEPEGQTMSNWHFSILQIQRFKKAQRLQNDLKLNLAGVALSLELLDNINKLRNQIHNLEHQLKLFTQL